MKKFVVLSIAMFMFFFTTVIAQAGLDPTFGEDGYVCLDGILGDEYVDQIDTARKTVIDEQGRILVIGTSTTGFDESADFIMRLNEDGSIDNTFGDTGVVRLADTSRANDISLYNNKIYLAGSFGKYEEDKELAVWRISENGEIENAESGQPSYRFNMVDNGEVGNAIVHNGAGKMYITGSAYRDVTGEHFGFREDMALWGFNVSDTSFELDTSFGDNGLVLHDDAAGGGALAGKNLSDVGRFIQFYNDRIWVAGNSGENEDPEAHPVVQFDIVVWSFDLNGGLDPNFNGTGFVAVGNEYKSGMDDPADSNDVRGFAIDQSGRLVLAGVHDVSEGEENSDREHALATFRLNSNGLFDRTYNQTGYKVDLDSTFSEAGGLMVDATNRIIVTGTGEDPGRLRHFYVSFNVIRYLEDGSNDTTFDGDGMFTIKPENGQAGLHPRHIVPYSDNKAIAIGYTETRFTNEDVLVWRVELEP